MLRRRSPDAVDPDHGPQVQEKRSKCRARRQAVADGYFIAELTELNLLLIGSSIGIAK